MRQGSGREGTGWKVEWSNEVGRERKGREKRENKRERKGMKGEGREKKGL